MNSRKGGSYQAVKEEGGDMKLSFKGGDVGNCREGGVLAPGLHTEHRPN